MWDRGLEWRIDLGFVLPTTVNPEQDAAVNNGLVLLLEGNNDRENNMLECSNLIQRKKLLGITKQM